MNNPIQLSLPLVLFLLLTLTSSTMLVTFDCRQVQLFECASGYQYRTYGIFQATILDSYYCVPPGSSCRVGKTRFNLQSCNVDYKGESCSTGVCFMYPQYPICTKSRTCGTAASPQYFYQNYKCDTCSNPQACSKCLFHSTNYPSLTATSTQTCLGQTCTQGLSTASTSINRCPNGYDELGQACECCLISTQTVRYCTDQSEPLMLAPVTTWFNRAEGEAKGNWGARLLAVGVVGVLGLVVGLM